MGAKLVFALLLQFLFCAVVVFFLLFFFFLHGLVIKILINIVFFYSKFLICMTTLSAVECLGCQQNTVSSNPFFIVH